MQGERSLSMTTTRTQIHCSAHETGQAITIELELPEGVEVDLDRLSSSRTDGTIEFRLPTTPVSEAVEHALRGFHPDAPPS